jgi:hypothetical protein
VLVPVSYLQGNCVAELFAALAEASQQFSLVRAGATLEAPAKPSKGSAKKPAAKAPAKKPAAKSTKSAAKSRR